MKKTTLLLTTRPRKGIPDSIHVVDYSKERKEASKSLRSLEGYALLWLEPASEIYYFDAPDLQAIECFVRNGGGFLVTGGIGAGFLFRTILEEMLPARAIFQEDNRPQMSVRDIKTCADSVWFTAGEIVLDGKSHLIVRGTGIESGMKLRGNYVSFPKPGVEIVARFNGYESMHAKLDLEPSLMPFISTWVWHGGRTVYIAADTGMLPGTIDAARLINNIVRFVRKTPTRHETITCRLAYCHGMMLQFHQRLALLCSMGIEPDEEDFHALKDAIAHIMASVHNHTETPIETVTEFEDGVKKWDRLLEGMEAGVFRSAFDSYVSFYRELTQAEIDGVFDGSSFEWLRYRGEMAKLRFNARAYFEAGKEYQSLCRAIIDARKTHLQAGKR